MGATRMRQELQQSIKSATKLTVEQYRDLIDEVFQKATDYQSCVGDNEKLTWLPYAEKLRLELFTAECPRATDRDHLRAKRTRELIANHIADAAARKPAENQTPLNANGKMKVHWDCPICGDTQIDSGSLGKFYECENCRNTVFVS